ncbi:hypothetical protein [Nocardioides marmorisolisilvae]|uniref:FlgD Ig-like domain-containing protein n=1 Tax=Nocardioides marmorisolisilvae TaxID=1542737 RepID=A0A3N0DZ33_9ACTN|nr:hypothetical protein [Nocardioides marmorisolisilvae]RNL80875.1 hypothetical protein EFL95_00345 [Nocardioides marmorisolisilvae]
MNLRRLPVALTIAAALAVPLTGLMPAYAAPAAAPVFSNLDSTSAGHLTGTIDSTGVPEIYVRFANTTGVQYRHVTLGGDSDTFDLPTWGYAGSTSIYALACPTADPASPDCSPETVVGTFTPTDLVPTVTWSADDKIGPAEQVTVGTVTDPGGGGLLFAQFDNDIPIPDPPRFALTDGAVANLEDGAGVMTAWRCDDLNTDQCAVFDPASPFYDIEQHLHLTFDPVTKITGNNPTTTVQYTNARSGTYDLTWHLERPGHPDPGVTGSVTGGTITAGALAPIMIDGADLPTSGTYVLKGSLTVHGDVSGFDGDYVQALDGSVAVSPTITVDHTGPPMTSVTASPTTIYPLVKDSTKYKSSTTFSILGTGVPNVVAVNLYKRVGTTDTFQRTLTLKPGSTSVRATATWSGLLAGSVPAPAGTYVVKLLDADGNAASKIGTVTVSGKKLVTKTWTKTVTPVGSLSGSTVARCSTLRTPSLRGWFKSLGYYANTRCASQTTADSLIRTAHAVILPSSGVVQYVDIRVDTYGGAARAKPGSKIRVRYLTTSKKWVSTRTLAGTLGTHKGETHSTSGLVFSDHSFGWGMYTGYGYQYDVKSFTIVLHYKVLG